MGAVAEPAGGPVTPVPAGRELRRDAQRNRDAILVAAQEVFSTQGLDAPLEEIARRANVGIGTLYRRFPTRLDLVDALLCDAVQVHLDIAEQALAMPDPWDGFVHYLEQTGAQQAADRGAGDLMGIRLPRNTAVEAVKAELYQAVVRIVARAQRSGQLRPDVTPEDLALITWASTRIVEATHSVAPQAWRRHLALVLDGFRAERAHQMPVRGLTPRQVYRAMLALGRRCSGTAGTAEPKNPTGHIRR